MLARVAWGFPGCESNVQEQALRNDHDRTDGLAKVLRIYRLSSDSVWNWQMNWLRCLNRHDIVRTLAPRSMSKVCKHLPACWRVVTTVAVAYVALLVPPQVAFAEIKVHSRLWWLGTSVDMVRCFSSSLGG